MADEPTKPKRDYDWMDRERFLKHYKLKIDSEFEVDGNAAEWAENGHRFWSQEDDAIVLETGDPDKREGYPGSTAALSPDNRVLAVSTNAVIRLYDIRSKTTISELRGHDENIEKMYFSPQIFDSTSRYGPDGGFTLISYGEHDYAEGRILIWRLHANGLPIDENVTPAVDALADRTLGTLVRDLKEQHGMSDEELGLLRQNLDNTIHQAAFKHQAKKGLRLLEAELPTFGQGNPISRDGTKLITLEKNETTQSGLRPSNEMPRIVIRNLPDLSEYWRLTGHQDAIMWAGWSPDGKRIAEASWDETYGIWNPEIKDRGEGHLIGPSGGQNWVGDFSADGKYILFSGGRPTKVAIYEVETGEEVAALRHPDHMRLSEWVRKVQWSPVDYTLAVIVDRELLLWRPLEEGSPQTTVLKLGSDGGMLDRYNKFLLAKWIDQGRKLIVRDVTNTVFVWDIKMNRKWRFEWPEGTALETYNTEMFFVEGIGKEGAVLSLDGDGTVRYWYL